MSTLVTFYIEPTNVDSLIAGLRLKFGDLTGSVYTDTIMRTALISGVEMLHKRWQGKYQVYNEEMLVDPQPSDVPAGYVYANTADGQAYIPEGLVNGDVFRNPFMEFTQTSPPIIQAEDRVAIILAARYILRVAQISSSVGSFVAWGTEDIRYSNLGAERSLSKLVESDLKELDDYFKSSIAIPQISSFPIAPIQYL
jgi:hypothetical protein